MPDVFISYKREERDAVWIIAERLRALALEVWFDADLTTSASFDEEVAAKLAEAKCVLVCWTPAAIASEWVRGEAALAHGEEKLVACCLEPTKLIPPFNLQQTEDLMRWAGQEDDPNWIRLLTGLGDKVGRPGIATFAAAMAAGAPLAALRTWASAHGADPLADRVWARIRLLEGESATARIAREQLEARSRDQRRRADEARSKALAKARGLRDPAEQRRRVRILAATIIAVGIAALTGVLYSIDAQNRARALTQAESPQDIRSFLNENGWHPVAADALRKYRTLDAAAWADARASGTLEAIRKYQNDFAAAPEGQFLGAAKALEVDAERVRRAQAALERLQIYRGPLHGGLDAPTRAAVETFRFRTGETVSDAVDDALIASLDRTIAALHTITPQMLVGRRLGAPSEDDYRALAARTGLDAPTLYAVRKVEAGPLAGFGPNGRPRISFERHIFSRLTDGAFDAAHPRISARRFGYPSSQDAAWAQLEEAYGLDPVAAYKATSFGLFGVMGMSYEDVGFESPGELAWFMSQSETNQVEVFVRWIEKKGLVPLLKQKDWVAFGRRWNGGLAYGPKLERAYAEGVRNFGFFVPAAPVH